MRTSDILILSLRQLKERKLRSILTLLAIAVGVTSIIALSAQVEGVSAWIVQRLTSLGPDTLLVIAQRTVFTDADVMRLTSLEGISTVTPMRNVMVTVAGKEDPVTLVGVSSLDLASLLGEIKLRDGNIYYDVPAPQVLMGIDIASNEFGELVYQAGQPVLVQAGKSSTMMIVVGILDAYGTSSLVQPDNSLFIPVAFMNRLTASGGYTQLMVRAKSSEDVDQVAELLGYVFGGRARVMSVKQLTETVISITSQMSLLLAGIAGTSFIAAGLGTFNIMMISVLERVREIGIVKAVGMKDKGVLTLYMTQGLLLGLFGSLTGLSLGSGIAYVIPLLLTGAMQSGHAEVGGATQGIGGMPGGGEGIISYTPLVTPTYVGMALALSIAVTLLSSAYPSWRASKLSPVEALRHE